MTIPSPARAQKRLHPDACIRVDTPHRFNLLAAGSSLLLLAGLATYAALDPAGFADHLAKDAYPGGTGAVEHFTVLVLIPAILGGLYSFRRSRVPLPYPLLRWWVLAWTLACVYFAGEEASWGQWYFGWDTPEFLGRLNRQGETNLHNMSSWLNQKPRALVELFVFVAGFLAPLWRWLRARAAPIGCASGATWGDWIYAPAALLPAGLLFAFVRIADWVPQPMLKLLGESEVREFAIAWFLMWYLISYAVRLNTYEQRATSPGMRE